MIQIFLVLNYGSMVLYHTTERRDYVIEGDGPGLHSCIINHHDPSPITINVDAERKNQHKIRTPKKALLSLVLRSSCYRKVRLAQ
jgi:hypothetical protein